MEETAKLERQRCYYRLALSGVLRTTRVRMRRFFSILAGFALATIPAHAGDIAIYKGLIITSVKRLTEDGALKTSIEKSNAYAVISLPDGLKQARVALLLPVKVGGQKLLRTSPPPAFNLSPTGFLQAIAVPINQGAFVLCGGTDYFGGYTGITLRGSIKDGLKEQVGASVLLPKTLNVVERYARRNEDSAYGFYERNGGVKINVELSSAANAAGDSFDAAVARVKALFPTHTEAFAL